MKNELSKMAERFSATRNLGTEQSRIYRFNRQLLDFLDTQAAGFRVLSANDFPAAFRTYDTEMRRLHKDLQQAMVGATDSSGETRNLKLDIFLKANWNQIDSLKRFWA